MVPVLKNSKNQLITGEGRYRSLLKLGSRHIACLTIENLSPEILRAYRIADNQLTRSSEFDFSKLQTEFKFLYDFKIFGRVIEISPHYCDIILWRWEGKKLHYPIFLSIDFIKLPV